MKRGTLLRRSFQTLLALTCLTVGGAGLLDALLEPVPSLASAVFRPDNGLALVLLGLALWWRQRGKLLACQGAALALLALAAYDLLHDALAGGHQSGVSLIGGYPSAANAMAAMLILLALGMLASTLTGTGRCLARIFGAMLMVAGALFLTISWFDATALTLRFSSAFTHHQTSSAASLMLMATGLSLLLMERPTRVPSTQAPERLALVAAALGALLTGGGWYLFSQQNLERLDQQSEAALTQVEAGIERALALHGQLLQRLAGRWALLDRLPTEAVWQQESQSYLDDFPAFELLAVLDDTLQPVWLAARESDEDNPQHPYLASLIGQVWWEHVLDHDGTHIGTARTYDEERPLVILALHLKLRDYLLVAGLDGTTLLRQEIVPDSGRAIIQVREGDDLLFATTDTKHAGRRLFLDERHVKLLHEVDWQLSSHFDKLYLKRLAVLPTLLLLAGLLLTYLLMISLTLFHLAEHRRQRLNAKQHALREALQQRDQFFTLSLELFCRIDLEGRFLQVNPAFEGLLDYPADRLVGGHYSALVREEDHPAIDTAIAQLGNGQSVQELEARVRDASGREHWVEINAALGEERVIYVVARDITNRKRAESQLRILERSVESSVNGVVIADARQRDLPIVYVNPAFERITGYSREEAIGRNCRFLQGENTEPRDRKTLRKGIATKRDLHVVVRNYRRDGTTFWNDLYISPVSDEAGEVTHFIGVQNDISTQREYQFQLAYNANHDALTGLPNRSLLEDRLRQGCQIASRYRCHLAVLFVDMDGFKPINDTLGHGIGDRILVEVARRLEKQLRHGDTVARFGGDEFVVVLPDLAREGDVMPVIERLLTSLSSPYLADGNELHITASIGIAFSDGDVEHSMQLIQQATLAMYKAKRQGRNTFQWFTPELGQKISERVSMRNALQRAIEEQQFELYYQPQVHGPSGQIIGVEALIRWRHPERGYVSPADFISLAENTGQIVPISDWVLATACHDGQRLNALGVGRFVMAVNVSPMQFQRSGFVTGVLEALDNARLESHLLELELTEGILMGSAESAIEVLRELRAHGIGIAIDDFGTGYSSLSYLKYLPISKIKIDRTFVKEVISDQRDAAIIQGVAAMATRLQLKVVAEGVETQAQYAYLSKQLCDTFQGYYFARPMPLEDLITFLGEHHQARSLEQARRDGEQGRQTLLLLDDEANILRALKRVLRRDGYHILTADTARQAFEMLATEEVEVIISDQRMPEMSGTEFLHRAKDLYPETIQIVLSGYTDLKTVTEAINEGAIYKFLTKPWDDDELRLVVQQAFRKAALQRVKGHHQRDH